MKWAGMRNIVGSFTWPNHPYFITVMDPFSISLNSIFLIKVYIATFHRDYNLFILILFNYLVHLLTNYISEACMASETLITKC